MKPRNVLTAVTLAAAVVVAPLGATSAAAIGVDIASGGFAQNIGNYTLGWGFDVTAPVTITSLGFWDEGANGLGAPHDVGLWKSDGTLLASTTVSAASPITVASASGLGNWVFQPIAPITLGAGTYQVGGVSNDAELYRTDVTTISLDPLLSNFNSNLFAAGSALQFMDKQEDSFLWYGLFGANLQVQPAHEPGTLALLGLGLAGLAAARRRRQ